MKKAESEIRSLFERYNDTLVRQKKDVSDKLTKWSSELVHLIESHVNTQRKLLEQHFDMQKRFLDAERKKLIQEVAAQEKKKGNEQIDRLLAECKALQLNLPKTEQYENPIPYIRVITEAQLALRKTDEKNANPIEESQSRNRSTEDNVNGTGNAASASRRSSLRPASARARSPKQRSVETQTSFEHDSSTNSGDNAQPDVKSEDCMNDKCPVCFMIFPKSMEKQERLRHVNEHYGDD